MSAENKIAATNRKARHEFEILDTYEAGVVLKGTEIKSIRQNQVNFRDSYARYEDGEIFIFNLHISPYDKGNRFNVDPLRKRKLLLHKHEIKRLIGKLAEKGLTLIPLKVYFKKSRAKIELGLARGKRTYDKRREIAKKDHTRLRQVEENDGKK